MKEQFKDFAHWLRVRMAVADFTTSRFAVAVGVTGTTVSQWRNGEQLPQSRYLGKMAKLLQVEMQELSDALSLGEKGAEKR